MTQAEIAARLAELREADKELRLDFDQACDEIGNAIWDVQQYALAVERGEDIDKIRLGLQVWDKWGTGRTIAEAGLTDAEMEAFIYIRTPVFQFSTIERLRAVVRGADEVAQLQQAVAV